MSDKQTDMTPIKWSTVKEIYDNNDGMDEWVRREEAEAMVASHLVDRSSMAVSLSIDELRKTFSDASNEFLLDHQHDSMSKTAMHNARFDAGITAIHAHLTSQRVPKSTIEEQRFNLLTPYVTRFSMWE